MDRSASIRSANRANERSGLRSCGWRAPRTCAPAIDGLRDRRREPSKLPRAAAANRVMGLRTVVRSEAINVPETVVTDRNLGAVFLAFHGAGFLVIRQHAAQHRAAAERRGVFAVRDHVIGQAGRRNECGTGCRRRHDVARVARRPAARLPAHWRRPMACGGLGHQVRLSERLHRRRSRRRRRPRRSPCPLRGANSEARREKLRGERCGADDCGSCAGS